MDLQKNVSLSSPAGLVDCDGCLVVIDGNVYLHQNQSVQLGDGLDAVLHLVISDLDEAAVALLPQHGIHPVPRHPGVHLDLLQLDSLSRILHQHLTDEGYQLRRQVGGCGNLTLLITIVIILRYDPPVMAVFGSCYK